MNNGFSLALAGRINIIQDSQSVPWEMTWLRTKYSMKNSLRREGGPPHTHDTASLAYRSFNEFRGRYLQFARLWPGVVRSLVMCSWHWYFSSSPRQVFGTFAMKVNSNIIFEHFEKTKAMGTNSNSNLSSNCCFLLEKCAHEAASLGASGHVNRVLFSCWGPCF